MTPTKGFDVMTAPYYMLNRLGRRTRAAMVRALPFTRLKEKVAHMMYRDSQARKDGLEQRLDAVRARTKARKGKVNNPRFR